MHVVVIIFLVILVVGLLLMCVAYLLMVLLASTPVLLASGILIPSVTYACRGWRLGRARRSASLSDYLQVGFDSSSYQLRLSTKDTAGSRSQRDLRTHYAALAACCVVLLAIPYVLYRTGAFAEITFFDAPASQEVSCFFSYVMTLVGIVYLLKWTRASWSSSLIEKEARKTVQQLNDSLPAAVEPIAALREAITETSAELGIAAPPAPWDRLARFVETEGVRALSEPEGVRRYVDELYTETVRLDSTLSRIVEERDRVHGQMRKTAGAVNRSGIASFIHEFDDYDQAFRSDSFAELLREQRWTDAFGYLEVLSQELERLEERAQSEPRKRARTAPPGSGGAQMDEEEARRVLQVPPTASWDDIRAMYRALSRAWHPDKTKDDDMQKRLNRAYELLRRSRA